MFESEKMVPLKRKDSQERSALCSVFGLVLVLFRSLFRLDS